MDGRANRLMRRSPRPSGTPCRSRPPLGSPSSRGLGRGPFKAKTRVRIPLGNETRVPPRAICQPSEPEQQRGDEPVSDQRFALRLYGLGAATVCNTLKVSKGRRSQTKGLCARILRLGSNSVRTEYVVALLLSQQQQPEVSLRFIHVVGAAAELQVRACRLSALGERDHVVKFEEPALGATTRRPEKRALTTVALPHLTPDGRRHMARPRHGLARRPRAIGLRQLLALQILQQQRERAIEDRRRIAVRD